MEGDDLFDEGFLCSILETESLGYGEVVLSGQLVLFGIAGTGGMSFSAIVFWSIHIDG